MIAGQNLAPGLVITLHVKSDTILTAFRILRNCASKGACVQLDRGEHLVRNPDNAMSLYAHKGSSSICLTTDSEYT